MKAKTREVLLDSAKLMSCCNSMESCHCEAPNCMAWREQKRVISSGQNRTARTIYIGWCGLAGMPCDEWDMTEEE